MILNLITHSNTSIRWTKCFGYITVGVPGFPANVAMVTCDLIDPKSHKYFIFTKVAIQIIIIQAKFITLLLSY